MSEPWGTILVLVVLTILEGFFVAAEIALVAIRRSRIEQLVEEGDRGAKRVRRLLDDPGRFLAVSQLGLTIIGFFASAYAAVSLVGGLQDLLEHPLVLRGHHGLGDLPASGATRCARVLRARSVSAAPPWQSSQAKS